MPPCIANVFTLDSDCIALSGIGSPGDPLTAAPILDPDPANGLSCGPAGLLGAGGLVEWEQVIFGDGTEDFALLNNPSGTGTFTWVANVLSRTDGGGVTAVRTWSPVRFEGPAIIEAEVAASGAVYAGGTWQAGILFGEFMEENTSSGGFFGTHAFFALAHNLGTGRYYVEGGLQGGTTFSGVNAGVAVTGRDVAAPGSGVFHKLRMVSFAGYIDCYYDGVLAARISSSLFGECLSFVSFNGTTLQWRNIKAWQASASWKNLPA